MRRHVSCGLSVASVSPFVRFAAKERVISVAEQQPVEIMIGGSLTPEYAISSSYHGVTPLASDGLKRLPQQKRHSIRPPRPGMVHVSVSAGAWCYPEVFVRHRQQLLRCCRCTTSGRGRFAIRPASPPRIGTKLLYSADARSTCMQGQGAISA